MIFHLLSYKRSLLAVMIAVLVIGNAALAVQPARWSHTTEADFQPGETVDTVVTNLGDIKLAHHTEELGEVLDQASIVYDLQEIGDALYIATGPQARLFRRQGGKTQLIFESKTEQLFSLDRIADGKLLLGLSGEGSRLAVLENAATQPSQTPPASTQPALTQPAQTQPMGLLPGAGAGAKLRVIAKLDKTRYIWDMLVMDQKIVLATGIEGKLLSVDSASGKVTELFDAGQANLLCIGADAKGHIFVGTDTDGLVYRVTLNKPDSPTPASAFVVYDAAEPEIGAILVRADGTVFAGTADAEQAKPGRLEKAASEETGRLQVEDKVDVKAEPEAPKPPPVEPPPNVPPKPGPVKKPGVAAATSGMMVAAKSESKVETKPEVKIEAKSDNGGQPMHAAAEPTTEQHDQLREEIRKRLMAARDSGSMQVGTAPRRPSPATAVTPRRTPPTGAAANDQRKKGNAVYRIDADGFVREVFRESVMILSLVESGGKLLVSTGSEGQVFSIEVAAEETTMLADLKPAQIPAMVRGDNGQITLGTANPAKLIRLHAGFATEGMFTSAALDASQISKWGALAVTGDIPEGTAIEVRTRSGNVADPDKAAWTPWSAAVKLSPATNFTPMTPHYVPIATEPARFLQYQAKLVSDGKKTPVLDRVEITYVVPNLAPQITAIKAAYPDPKPAARPSGGSAESQNEPPVPDTIMKVEWKAEDPNGDALIYRLEYQMAGSEVWLLLKDALDQTKFDWETRRMPDGRYKLRVIASDTPDNPADAARKATRQSDPLLVDNTPPAFADVAMELTGGKAQFKFKVTDELSPLKSVHWSVDGSGQWEVVLPDDWIMDSTTESFTATIAGLAPGRHAVTLRAIDGRGNASYKALFVTVK